MKKYEGPRVLVALDYDDADRALAFAKRLPPSSCRLKVGKELFTRCGPSIIDGLQRLDFDVFLDLKFHDIPNTVARACRTAADMGVWMLNVHASGGREMMAAAKNAVASSNQRTVLIAVTVLTSLSEKELKEIGYSGTIDSTVERLALLARDCGLDGVVCSAREAAMLRNKWGTEACLVTPGIRPSGFAFNDQTRIMTPKEAIAAGSNYLVVGRPITTAQDPVAVLNAINAEIAAE